MSTTTGITNSSGADYAMDLAKTSQLRRSLNNFGLAIERGNLTSARSIFTAVMKSQPDHAQAPGDTTTETKLPINKGFAAVAAALDAGDPDAAKAAWGQLKSDLGKSGVLINDGKAATTRLLADTRAAQNQKLLGNLLGVSSGDTTIVGTLLRSDSRSNSQDTFSSVISNWLTYQSGGKSSPANTDSALDTKV